MTIIQLPVMHVGQNAIYKERSKRNVVRCGRRWGKTKQMVTMAANAAVKGLKVCLCSPEHKQLSEPFDELKNILDDIKQSSNKNNGEYRTTTGGKLDFWALNDNELAGRGREYDLILGDEIAFAKNGQISGIWERSLKPTMLTTKGSAWMFSTPNGSNSDNFFYEICTNKELGWKEFHAPTINNPYVTADELEEHRKLSHPLVFRQEYLAEFIDWSGVAFFSEDSLTVNKKGVAYTMNCDYVFATVDSAMKDGSGNDGTSVVYWGVSKYFGHKLTILDWDIVQINSDLLSTWLPNVFKNLESFASTCKARMGSAGAWIEDKGSGITLNQTSARMGWPAQPIQGDITSIGKDGRAISASGAVFRGEVKISEYAHTKVMEFKGKTKNHLLDQVCSYRIGDKDAAKRADDLFDAFAYGIIIALNGQDGF
jgi:hypothetical protein